MQAHLPESGSHLRRLARWTRRGLWSRCLAGLAFGAASLAAQPPEGELLPPVPPLAKPAALQPPDPMPKPPSEPAPPPRPFDPAGPDAPGRLPRLGTPRGVGTTPRPSAETLREYAKYVKEFVDPQSTLDLVLNRTRLMRLNEAPFRTQIGDESVAALSILTPKEITLIGRKVGTTTINLWFRDEMTKEEKILSYLVRVIPDPDEKARREAIYKALEDEINEFFPDAAIRIYLVGDKIAVCGQAKDVAEATQILRIVRSNAPAELVQNPVANVSVNVSPDEFGNLPNLRDFLLAGGPNIINLLRIPGEQQVMLKVTVAEVNRTAARSIGLNFSITNNQGIQVFANNTGITGGDSGGGGGGIGANAAALAGGNLPIVLDNGQINLAVTALKNLNYAKSLAEPNLVALNGQTASFQAGGSFPVPVVSDSNNNNGTLGGVQFVPFGVLLNFTPFIVDRDRIRLQIAAEVSTRDLSTGSNVNGSSVSGLNTRNFTTTVELREGQTLAVAGLMANNLAGDSSRLPFLGDLPFIGQFTGQSRIQAGEQELVILVTPELVSPLDHKEVAPLPGSDIFEPSDLEFYVHGRIEGRHTRDFRSPVRSDHHRLHAFRQAEERYIFGPAGFSD